MPQEPRQKTAATQPIPVGRSDRAAVRRSRWRDMSAAACSRRSGPTPRSRSRRRRAIGRPARTIRRPGYLFFTTGVSTRKFSPTGRISVPGTREYGLITALDSRTNKQVWQKEVPYLAGFGSGVLATAGGLLFHGGTDGFFRAFDSKTGEELWRFQTGFGADAPAATYEIGGEQYVAIAAGGSRDGFKEARGDLVWSFKLGGRLNPLNGPPAPPPVVTVEAPPNRQPE